MLGFKNFLRTIFKTKSFFLSFLLILTFPENVSAGILNLNCNNKSHYKNENSEIWKNSNYQYEFEINQRTKKIVLKKVDETIYDAPFTIINQTENQIIAILDIIFPNQEGILLTGLTLDLNSQTITGVNTINSTKGIAFDNFYGKCFQK